MKEAKVFDAFDEELAKMLANPSLASSSTARTLTPDGYLHQLAAPNASARAVPSPAHALSPAPTLPATYTSGTVDFAIASSSMFALIDNPEAAQGNMQNDMHDMFGPSGSLSGELFDDLLGGVFAPSQQMTPDFGFSGKGKDTAGILSDFPSQGSDSSLASTPFPAALFDIPANPPSTGDPHMFDPLPIAGPSSASSSSPSSSGESSTPSTSSKDSLTSMPEGLTPACRLTYRTPKCWHYLFKHCYSYSPQYHSSSERTSQTCRSSMLRRLCARGDILC